MAGTLLAVQLGQRIGQLRYAHGWSQAQLARRAGVPGKSVISYYESGERYPRYETLLRIAKAFGVTTDYLLMGETQEIRIDAGSLTTAQLDAVITIVRELQRGNEIASTQAEE